MHDVFLLLFCFPLAISLIAAKVFIALYVADRFQGECVVYSIYKDNKLRFSTTIKKEATAFYTFMLERYGELAIRLEKIGV